MTEDAKGLPARHYDSDDRSERYEAYEQYRRELLASSNASVEAPSSSCDAERGFRKLRGMGGTVRVHRLSIHRRRHRAHSDQRLRVEEVLRNHHPPLAADGVSERNRPRSGDACDHRFGPVALTANYQLCSPAGSNLPHPDESRR